MDTALRTITRSSPDTEAHAAALRRAGQAREAGRIYRALADAAQERADALWATIREVEWTARMDGLAPSSGARSTMSLAGRRALRADWRAWCAERRRLVAVADACDTRRRVA